MSRCAECGLGMTYIDGSRFHPTCDPTVPENTVIAERAEAHRLQVAGQDQAATSAPDDYGLAKNIVNRAALSMRVFSANDVRLMDSRWEQLHSLVRGSAFTYACRQGWISRTYGPGDKSSSRATHGHEVHRYETRPTHHHRKQADHIEYRKQRTRRHVSAPSPGSSARNARRLVGLHHGNGVSRAAAAAGDDCSAIRRPVGLTDRARVREGPDA